MTLLAYKQIAPLLRALKEPREYKESLPDSKLLQRTINECFWASLQVEEARPVRASIVFARQKEVPQSICFKKPVMLTKSPTCVASC